MTYHFKEKNMPLLTFKQDEDVLFSYKSETVSQEQIDEVSTKLKDRLLSRVEIILVDGATVKKCQTVEDMIRNGLIQEVFYNLK
jgi:hypothetical protein